MELLDPKEIKQEKLQNIEQAKERIKKLAIEELRLVKNINFLRTEEIEQKKKTEQTIDEAETVVRKKILDLKQEVKNLEERKIKALKPIDDKQKEFDQQFSEIQEAKNQVEKEKNNLNTDREALLDRIENIIDNEKENDEKVVALDDRKNNIIKAEAEIKRLTRTLGGKWVDFHKAMASLNEEIKKNLAKEKNIATREKAIEDRKNEQDKHDNEIQNARALLKSNYEALETAKKHLNIK